MEANMWKLNSMSKVKQGNTYCAFWFLAYIGPIHQSQRKAQERLHRHERP